MSTQTSQPTFTIQSGSEIAPQALAQLMGEIKQHDQNGEEFSSEDLQTMLTRGRRIWWVIRAADLAGYAWGFPQTSQRVVFYLAIHPNYRRQGLGSRLLAQIIEHARQTGAAHITSSPAANNAAANAFLRQKGLRVVGSEWLLHAPAESVLAGPVWPEGFRVERYSTVNNPAILVDACNRSRRDMWGHSENTPGAVTEDSVPRILSYWSPENIYLAFAPDGQVAGICAGNPNAFPQGHLMDGPTIVPEYRDSGLQRPFVLTLAQALRSSGPGEIRLESYGDLEPTIDIYREAGFILDSQYLSYCYELSFS
jgi:ribosomal protein S18 acetylase RimI-like enzyme